MPIYNVALSTSYNVANPNGNNLQPIQSADKANCIWRVNFEGLFGQDLLKYKKCYLRYKLASDPTASMTGAGNLGFLALTGISTDKQAGYIGGTYLDLLQVETAPVAASSYRFYQSNMGDMHGIQINVPTGTIEVGVRFLTDDALTFQTNVPHYVMTLQFYLTDE